MAVTSKGHSNLESFLDSITPSVRARFAPKSRFQDLNTTSYLASGNDMVKYFTLSDFWDCYYEWSACGAAVPIRLADGKFLFQYYAPTLSAVQLYRRKPYPRNVVEDTENEVSSYDNGSSRGHVSENLSFVHERFPLGKEEPGDLYYQFSDKCTPYARLPLFEKVYELAKDHPGLITYKSLDLSSASWISVAWYPIYHIPGQKNVKELSARFLTYHSISSCFHDSTPADMRDTASCVVAATKMGKQISFTPFGLATYNMHNDFWLNLDTGDQEMKDYLLHAADSLLKEQNVRHNDYIFFKEHFM